MPIDIKMPALSPTMEQGTLAKWLVKQGDTVKSGDILAEIETDKATMEFEAVDEGTITSIAVPEGSEGVSVGTVIATLAGDDEDIAAPASANRTAPPPTVEAAPRPAEMSDATTAPADSTPAPVAMATPAPAPVAMATPAPAKPAADATRVIASPLARRIAADRGIDLGSITGSGPHGRIVKADLENARPGTQPIAAAQPAAAQPAKPPAPAASATSAPSAPDTVEMAAETRALLDPQVPHTVEKLSGMRKTIARRLVQSKQEVPHIYLSVDIRLDRLLALRTEVNAALEKQGIKVSVNDMLVKALARALIAVPECNVTFAGDELIRYARADISVAVSIPGGLITPIVRDADARSLSSIAKATKELAGRAKAGKLKPEEYQGGTASLSNMGMMGIRQFSAIINPPQGMILAIGAGEKRPWVMGDGTLGVADVMSATGSFDHRAIDGADGARLMDAFRAFVESPLGMLA